MGLWGDSRAEGTSSPVELGPARQSQLFLPRLGRLHHFSVVDSLVSSNRVELPFGGGILVQASSSIQTPVFVKLLGI